MKKNDFNSMLYICINKIQGRLETRVSFANIPHRVYEEVPTMSLTTLLGDIGGVMARVKKFFFLILEFSSS